MEVQIAGVSVTTALSAGTPNANVAIPNTSAGRKAQLVLVTSDLLAAFQPVQTAGAPALANMARIAAGSAYAVVVSGYAELRLSRVGANDANVTVTPLEGDTA